MTGPIRASDVAHLASTERNGFIENRFFGSAVVVNPSGQLIGAVGDPAAGVYPRSALKPFQAIAALRCGAPFHGEALALAAGSHIGSREHRDIAAGVLDHAGLQPDALACPATLPSAASEVARAALDCAPLPLERTALAHNCSGKHAGFLAATVAAGESVADYLEPQSPIQREVIEVIEQYCQTTVHHIGVDGCGAPTPVMSLSSLARGFGALGRAVTDRGAELHATMVAQAMLDYPSAVQGRRRPDTVVLEELGLIAKTGADGILAIGAPDGTAVAVSMIDSTHRANHLIALALLANFAPEAVSLHALTDVMDRLVPALYGGYHQVGRVKLAPAVLRLLD